MADFIQQNSRSYVRMRSPQQERLKDVLHEAGIDAISVPATGTLEIDGVEAERLGELAAQHQIVLHELSPQRASLEEAFMRMTADSVEYHAHAPGAPGFPAGPGAATDNPARPADVPAWGAGFEATRKGGK